MTREQALLTREEHRGPEVETNRPSDKISASDPNLRNEQMTSGEVPKTIKAKPSTIFWMFLVAAVGVGIILYAWRLWPFASDIEITDNSYIRGQITVLAPQVSGYITEVMVQDFQRVKAGQPLVRVDDRIFRQQLNQADGRLESAHASLSNSEQTIAQNRAQITLSEAGLFRAEAEFARAEAELKRATSLGEKGVTTQASVDQALATRLTAQAAVRQASASIEIAKQTLRSSEVARGSLVANVSVAEADVELARINLANTVIYAPRDGQVSEASVRLGQYVSADSQLLFLVPETHWIVANFQETQTEFMHVGQEASFTVDALGGATFTGRIVELAPATGSEFSVLRPDNASGNFTKVVQRLPVRISIDPGQDRSDRLRPGMSVVSMVEVGNMRQP